MVDTQKDILFDENSGLVRAMRYEPTVFLSSCPTTTKITAFADYYHDSNNNNNNTSLETDVSHPPVHRPP